MTMRFRFWCPTCKAFAKKVGLACAVCATLLTAVPDDPHSHQDDPTGPQPNRVVTVQSTSTIGLSGSVLNWPWPPRDSS